MQDINTILFDLNGTLYERGVAIPDVNDTLNKLRQSNYQLSFVTNTDSRSISDVHQRVVKMGLNLELHEVYTPVTAVKAFIAGHPDKSFYPLVHDEVLADLSGINRNDTNPDYVIIGDFCDKVSHGEINKVFRMIKGGAQIIALSKTLWYIDVDGYTINTGAYVRMFEIACDKEALLMGKPSEAFLRLALDRTNSRPENTLVVGDDIKTDIWGAKLIGARNALVRTGVFDAGALEASEYKPDVVLADVNQLPQLLGI